MPESGFVASVFRRMNNGPSEGFSALVPNRKVRIILCCVAGALLIVLPWLLNDYAVDLLVSICLCGYIAQCWNLMSGYAGQFSFGHVAFFGVGAYTSSLLYVDFGISPWLGMLVGVVTASLVGMLIGFLSFKYKLKGDYFALVTLAFGEMLRVIANNVGIFKKAVGVSITYKSDWTVYQFDNKAIYFYIILAMMVLLTVFLYKLSRTKLGLYFVAIREDENAANALGVDSFQYKMIAVTLSAALTALAGTFYAQYYLFIDPSIAFNMNISINAITPCIIGGVGTVFGPIIGAAIITPLSQLTNAFSAGRSGLNMMVYGVIVIAVIMLMPNGVIGLVKSFHRKHQIRHAKKDGASH